MTKKNDTTFFENKLLDFVTAKDPMLEMLQWVIDKFMEIEAAHKTGAEKGSHAETRTGYRCGYRIRRFDTRLGSLYVKIDAPPSGDIYIGIEGLIRDITNVFIFLLYLEIKIYTLL